MTRTERRALANMAAIGWSCAFVIGASERTMRKLVADGLACVSPPYRIRRSLDTEYGITQAGRDALKIKEVSHMDTPTAVEAIVDIVRDCKKITNKEVLAIAVIVGNVREAGIKQGLADARKAVLDALPKAPA